MPEHTTTYSGGDFVMQRTSIQQIQGTGLSSPLAGQRTRTRGVVTGHLRKGFFLEDPDGDPLAQASRGVFVFSRGSRPPLGALVEVDGRVLDYSPRENEHPTTQLELSGLELLQERGPVLTPTWLTASTLALPNQELAQYLNSLEGMLVGLQEGATLIAPSNPFGDYVAIPADLEVPRTRHGGVCIQPDNPQRWYPGFRIVQYDRAPRVNVGSRLVRSVVGPLNYRASAYQIAALGNLEIEFKEVHPERSQLASGPGGLTILTLNGFNLDRCHEDPQRVNDARRDVDDDVGDGRFRALARAIVEQARSPEIVALQEIQDDDGAEITGKVSADATYRELVKAIRSLEGPEYRWIDLPPKAGEDGGQPGGNIRNGFIYDPGRVALSAGGLQRIGEEEPDFDGSRKPLVGKFVDQQSGRVLVVINVHLASKRHQHGIFALENPGHDPRLGTRVNQARVIARVMDSLDRENVDYYLTGDFNDYEFSETLAALLGNGRVNLAERVPANERYDYNHRGISQVLMHGIVSARQAAEPGVQYEILHGNELIGVQPGTLGAKPTDHAYVMARV